MLCKECQQNKIDPFDSQQIKLGFCTSCIELVKTCYECQEQFVPIDESIYCGPICAKIGYMEMYCDDTEDKRDNNDKTL